jgi:biopolymer transport protein ExbB/TolQ
MLTVSRVTSFSEWLLRQAFIWGGLACLAFYALVVRGAAEGSFVSRYFAGHTIAYCATGLFFMGTAALLIRLFGITLQWTMLESFRLPGRSQEGQKVEETPLLLKQLDKVSAAMQDSYLVRRLREALQYVQCKGSADALESQLRHLEEVDLGRMHQGYAMVRIILSTIPILGFLGTVIGITLAIAKLNLSGEAMDQSLPAVVGGLSVAFDTTALALSLSTVLLFLKFCVERVEIRLLEAVDASVSRQLIGRFEQYGTENDPYLASICRMSEELITSVQNSMVEQASLLKKSFDQTGRQWSDLLHSTASTLDEVLSGAVVEGMSRHAAALNEGVQKQAHALEETLVRHAQVLNEGLEQHSTVLIQAERELAQENRRHLTDVESAMSEAMLLATGRQEKLVEQNGTLLQEMQTTLLEAAGSTVAQQEQLIRQGDIMLQVVEATGQVKQLENALNSNLNALANSQNFQQTVAGLSAALQLMSVHLVGRPLGSAQEIELAHQEQKRAA